MKWQASFYEQVQGLLQSWGFHLCLLVYCGCFKQVNFGTFGTLNIICNLGISPNRTICGWFHVLFSLWINVDWMIRDNRSHTEGVKVGHQYKSNTWIVIFTPLVQLSKTIASLYFSIWLSHNWHVTSIWRNSSSACTTVELFSICSAVTTYKKIVDQYHNPLYLRVTICD